jgi:hypothetical protein
MAAQQLREHPLQQAQAGKKARALKLYYKRQDVCNFLAAFLHISIIEIL